MSYLSDLFLLSCQTQDPSLLGLAWPSNPRHLGVASKPDLIDLGLAGSDNNAKPKSVGFGDHVRSKLLGSGKWPLYPSKQQINKGQLNTLIVRREKRKKKQKQLITDGNLTIINLHALHHLEESTPTHLSRLWMTRFDHREVFSRASLTTRVPPTRWDVWNTHQ